VSAAAWEQELLVGCGRVVMWDCPHMVMLGTQSASIGSACLWTCGCVDVWSCGRVDVWMWGDVGEWGCPHVGMQGTQSVLYGQCGYVDVW
jgi:hypothetical protein